MADTPDLGRALAEFAAICSVRSEPSGAVGTPQPRVEDAVPAFLHRAAAEVAARQPQPRPESAATKPRAGETPPSPAARTTSDPPESNGSAPSDSPASPAIPIEPEPSSAPPRVHVFSAAAPLGGEDDPVGELERRLGLRQPDL